MLILRRMPRSATWFLGLHAPGPPDRQQFATRPRRQGGPRTGVQARSVLAATSP